VSHNNPVHPRSTPAQLATPVRVRVRRATTSLLLVLLACTVLSACASTVNPVKQASAREVRLAGQEHAELLELVSCARAHGIDLPEPTASNKISTRGVNLKGRRRKAALNACYQHAVSKAKKEHEAEQAKEGKQPGQESAQSTAQSAAAFAREHEQLVEVVSCARRHGIHLPEPNAHNQVNTRGVDIKGHRREVAMSDCFHKVVSKAAAEAQAEQREREAGPRRLGEEAPAAP
jgi:hypothetical protein